MSEHYYTNKPTTDHNRQSIEEILRGKKYTFTTDRGVFSKAGVDYGSKVLIESMIIPADAKVLDVGCGYGPIGIVAAGEAHLGQVTMVDINERAIQLARDNAKRNRTENVNIIQSDLFEKLEGQAFSIIVTNPPIRAGKETVHKIFMDAHEHLVPGGQLWIVIQKKQGAPSALAKLESLYAKVEEVTKDKGYRIYKATKKI